MVVVTLMWSIAGVVTRHLEAARGFEVTFWRSAFNALALVACCRWMRGPAALWRRIRGGGRALWMSGLCWSVMYTAFMLALTLTTVANVLITMALAPLFTALGARLVLGHRLPARTWAAIAVAGAGIAWMYGREVSGAGARTCWARWWRWACRSPRPSTGRCCSTCTMAPCGRLWRGDRHAAGGAGRRAAVGRRHAAAGAAVRATGA
jgi:drug/metabolite transporter (DMT)-like permease